MATSETELAVAVAAQENAKLVLSDRADALVDAGTELETAKIASAGAQKAYITAAAREATARAGGEAAVEDSGTDLVEASVARAASEEAAVAAETAADAASASADTARAAA
mmetsp:Transcript_11237/g.37131  ORF Transcript_11237/g.37131 Transcript_11237/m.37131 type:complete len:111 (-) Transcript_11237:293-625(-)